MAKYYFKLNERQKEQILNKTYSTEIKTSGTLCNTIELTLKDIVSKYETKVKNQKAKPMSSNILVNIDDEFEKKLTKLCNHIAVSPSQLLRVVLFQEESDQTL